MQVKVHNKSNLEMAIRTFRKKAQKEGIIREAKVRKAYEKPSEKEKRRKEESLVRTRRSRRRDFTAFKN
jgi:small subunit ribosomal protein S21